MKTEGKRSEAEHGDSEGRDLAAARSAREGGERRARPSACPDLRGQQEAVAITLSPRICW